MRKIAIVAKAGTSALAPWRDETWEIWGLPWVSYPRVDKLFELHTQHCCDTSPDNGYRTSEWYPAFLEKHGDVPVYCHESRARLFKNPIPFPFDEVIGSVPFPYFENSIAYQIAFAMMQEPDEIGLWGVHMMGRREYIAERPSVTYLIGLAQGKGIKITMPGGTPLMASYWTAGRYGLTNEERVFF